jgi:hypothetical protein
MLFSSQFYDTEHPISILNLTFIRYFLIPIFMCILSYGGRAGEFLEIFILG